MRGTDRGALPGLPPSGRAIALQGADFIVVEGDLIRSVTGYFDQKAFVEQLGLQVVVQPYAIGPFTFGTSVRTSGGSTAAPGLLGLTALTIRSEAEAERVATMSREILMGLMGAPGFISAVTGRTGDRMYTVSAWETPEAMAALLSGPHRAAIEAFYGEDFTLGGVTGVWQPARINGHLARCPACHKMGNRDENGGKCACGEMLPVLADW